MKQFPRLLAKSVEYITVHKLHTFEQVAIPVCTSIQRLRNTRAVCVAVAAVCGLRRFGWDGVPVCLFSRLAVQDMALVALPQCVAGGRWCCSTLCAKVGRMRWDGVVHREQHESCVWWSVWQGGPLMCSPCCLCGGYRDKEHSSRLCAAKMQFAVKHPILEEHQRPSHP